MSVLVTTTFSQGAVFYAGETLSCTIAFTNPIHSSKPPPPPPPPPPQQQNRTKTRSISSIASSTLAFLTRTPLLEDDPVVPLELDSPTPRSSIDTFIHQPSPRSSIDSNTSSFRSRRYSNSPLKRPSSEQLMCGFAQVVGSFIADPNLINLAEFDPLKRHTMYTPQGGFGGGGGLMMNKADASLDTRTLPVFSTPPSILFVNLDLAPGETKKFSYKIQLPNDIPPSHRGKAIRFNYYLVVGAQCKQQPQGQVVQIRFRVLNHVAENGSRPIYDLMNPVVRYKDEAIIRQREQEKEKVEKKPERQDKAAFLDYLDLLCQDTHSLHDHEEQQTTATTATNTSSCSQIVSRITHQSRKAMYDLCKQNQRVAKLHLVKTAHRLGEPVVGVLDFSEATLSTFKISIFLESTESVQDTIALRSAHHIQRVSKKTHSDFHSFCLDHQRLAFSLPIPATASPEFQTTGVSLAYFLRFEFITSIDNQPPFIPIMIDQKHRHHQCLQDVEVSTFDCQIPLTVYGSPGGVDRALYGRPHTFRV